MQAAERQALRSSSQRHAHHPARLQVDAVLVEYAVNDQPGVDFEGDQRKGFERLLRKLLNYPKKPAVILVNSFAYLQSGEPDGAAAGFWRTCAVERCRALLQRPQGCRKRGPRQ
jgi:hypothetical protein